MMADKIMKTVRLELFAILEEYHFWSRTASYIALKSAKRTVNEIEASTNRVFLHGILSQNYSLGVIWPEQLRW